MNLLHSVRIDVDQLLLDRERERLEMLPATQDTPVVGNQKPKARKRNRDESIIEPKGKKLKATKDEGTPTSVTSKPSIPKLSITIKIGPQKEIFPCYLCVSEDKDGLLPIYDPISTTSTPKMAHEHCASVIPETWVDDYEVDHPSSGTAPQKKRVVFGVDGIVKDRWNLVGHIIHFGSLCSWKYYTRNALLVQNHDTRHMGHQYNVPRASVPRPFTLHVPGTGRGKG